MDKLTTGFVWSFRFILGLIKVAISIYLTVVEKGKGPTMGGKNRETERYKKKKRHPFTQVSFCRMLITVQMYK